MAEQDVNLKIQPLLAALLARQQLATTSVILLPIHSIVQVQSETDVEVVQRAIERAGGQVLALRRTEIEARLLPSVIDNVAAMSSVVGIRLARIHSVQ